MRSRLLEGRDVCFVVMPWGAVYQPAIQVGILQARLKAAGITAGGLYANLNFAERVGLRAYERYGDFHNLCADWVFSESLFGSFVPASPGLPSDFLTFAECRGVNKEQQRELLRIKRLVPSFLDWCADAVDWCNMQVVGFTTTMLQTLPALALAQRLKASHPHLKILFGGAGCQGVMGTTMHECFPFIDGIVDGEADEIIEPLVSRLLHNQAPVDVPGVSWRSNGHPAPGPPGQQVDLSHYPLPDYEDYFDQVQTVSYRSALALRVPFEASRGCWWAVRSQCKFCGLNGDILAQRVRPVDAVIHELRSHRVRHGVTTFVATDNVLAPTHVVPLPRALREELPGAELFFEVRAVMTRVQMEGLARGGITHLQAGLESLVPQVLEMVDKGTRPIINLCFLRRAQELGIKAYWNFLYGFPEEQIEWYQPLLTSLPRFFHLEPPEIVRFSLQRFSPYFDDPSRYGIRVKGPTPGTEYIWNLPAQRICDLSYELDFDPPGRDDREQLGARLRAAAQRWADAHSTLRAVLLDDGWVGIADTRPVPGAGQFTLPPLSSWVLRCLERPTALGEIADTLLAQRPDLYLAGKGQSGCVRVLQDLVARGIVYTEDDQYLALPVPGADGFWIDPRRPAAAREAQRRPLQLRDLAQGPVRQVPVGQGFRGAHVGAVERRAKRGGAGVVVDHDGR